MGEVFHRLAGRFLAHAFRHRMKEALAPLQFGVGVSDGATVVYRGVEALLAANPEWGVLSWTYRTRSTRLIALPCSKLSGTGALGTGSPSSAFSMGAPLTSCTPVCRSPQPSPLSVGAARGPSGPFLFAITFQDVLIAANSALQEAGGGRVLAFHDDAPIMGPVHALDAAFEAVVREGERRGLRIQPRKSLLYRVSEHVTVPLSLQGIPLAEEGLVLLGCPLGTPEYCEAWRQQWLAESTACLAELGALEDPRQPFVSSGTVSSLALSSGSVYSPPTQLGSAPWRPLTRASGGQSFSSWASTLRTPASRLTHRHATPPPSRWPGYSQPSPSPLGAWAYHPWRP